MRRNRILIIVENLSVPFDRRVWREALALKEAGFTVSVISPTGSDRDREKRCEREGVAIYRYRPRESRSGTPISYAVEYLHALFSMAVLSLRVLYERGFDAIQLCNPPDLLFLLALPYKLCGKRVVFDHHDLSPEVFVAKGNGEAGGSVAKGKVTGKTGVLLRLLRWCERATFAAADTVISTNDSFRRIALERGGKRPEDVSVVRNGPSFSELRNVEPMEGLREGKRYLIVYVGIMGSQDGVALLLEAISHLTALRGRRDFRLVLFGDGPEFESLRRDARKLDITDVVSFQGRVPYESVLRGVTASDLCVCPDPYTPLTDKSTLVKVLEYMSLGKPLVAFDLSETRASAASAARYATPNDTRDFAEQMNLLLESGALRMRLGQEGKRRVYSSLAWDYAKERLISAYRRLLDGNRLPEDASESEAVYQKVAN